MATWTNVLLFSGLVCLATYVAYLALRVSSLQRAQFALEQRDGVPPERLQDALKMLLQTPDVVRTAMAAISKEAAAQRAAAALVSSSSAASAADGNGA